MPGQGHLHAYIRLNFGLCDVDLEDAKRYWAENALLWD